MNGQLEYMIGQQRAAELQRDAGHERLAGFTLHGRHIARLDRFLGQARRAARRAEQEFEGVIVEINGQGTVTVHAPGMTSILLSK
jgi:hypothetical protein